MAGKTVEQANRKKKSHPQSAGKSPAPKGTKGSGQKGKNRHHSKGKSKKSGFGCCRKKQVSPEKPKKHSKTTKKQPKPKAVKPLAPVPNEQLGEIVLVKNIDKAKKTAPIDKNKAPEVHAQTPVTPKAKRSDELVKSLSKEKMDDERNEKDGEVVVDKEEKKVKIDEKILKVEKQKPEKIEIEREKDESEEKKVHVKKVTIQEEPKRGDSTLEGSEPTTKPTESTTKPSESFDILGKKNQKKEKRDKWMRMAKNILSKDATIIINDFNLVAGYIPPHVSKRHFMANMNKNRFHDVICLDHSRVHLRDNTYIHASYVDIDSQKKAILTQLPLKETASDFWQMMIEKRVKCLLLILTDQEYEKFGGRHVFPKNLDFLSFNDREIRVGEFRQVELSKGWNLKVLSLTNGNYKEYIHVHHFKLWPHKKSPSNVKQMWQLQSALRKYSSPPVYMSLSGCGRAGTYALFESSHASLHSDHPQLELSKCLETIRSGRMHSVQSLSQFSLVYTLLAEHVLGNGFCRLIKKYTPSEEEQKIEAILKTLIIR